jgi:hypothetical protein
MTLFQDIAPAKLLGFILLGMTKVLGLSAIVAAYFAHSRPWGAPLLILSAVCLLGTLGIALHFRSVEGKEEAEEAKERSKIRDLARYNSTLLEEIERYRSQLDCRNDLFSKYPVRAR